MLLVFFIIRTWRQSRTRGDFGPDQSCLKLTKKVDKLIAEWEPEPLVENIPVTTQSLLCPPIIIGIPDIRPKILYGEPALRFTESMEGEAMIYPKDIRTVTNLAKLERDIAQFIVLPSSLINAQGFSSTSSAIPKSNSKKLSNYPPYKFDLLKKNKKHHKNTKNSKKKIIVDKKYITSEDEEEEEEDDDELR
ncbi:hypothetical protein BY996DRAFT_8466257 [Phakopsora pachyrhizi]|nr:hypothetical protein BY996DRAFT_8466257 [Phakopsora pachyrhizi]